MLCDTFLFDTYETARRTLIPFALKQAVCTAIRLGRSSLLQERQAALLLPLLQEHRIKAAEVTDDEYLQEILTICVRRLDETPEAFARRVVLSSNLSAIRLVLANWYQQEYGDDSDCSLANRIRRKTIRLICDSLPPEVHSDILQGELKPEDADFLSLPDFSSPYSCH